MSRIFAAESIYIDKLSQYFDISSGKDRFNFNFDGKRGNNIWLHEIYTINGMYPAEILNSYAALLTFQGDGGFLFKEETIKTTTLLIHIMTAIYQLNAFIMTWIVNARCSEVTTCKKIQMVPGPMWLNQLVDIDFDLPIMIGAAN